MAASSKDCIQGFHILTITVRSKGDKLLDEAFAVLTNQLHDFGSVIDETTEIALKAVQEHMVHMLVGELREPKVYLSSLDPGKGKTEAVCALLKAWKHNDFRPEGSILIGLSRLEEIRSYINRSGLEENDFAVLVDKSNDMNTVDPAIRAEARVLFTTHEMIYRRTQAGPFEELDCYQFRGRPRSLRIWDESLLPAQPMTLRLDGINALMEPLRPIAPDLAERIDSLSTAVGDSAVGDLITVPQELALCQTERLRAALSPVQWENLGRLACLAGHQALLQNCNRYGPQLVAASRRLPGDFAPAIVLDASGRVRHTYRVWEQHGDNLVRLPEAATDYANLTVHHWNRAANKEVLADTAARQSVLQVIADLINASPSDEEWLIIHHKTTGKSAVPKDLQALVDHPDRLRFVHWGNHHGTNDYRQVRRVVVIGLWNYADAAYAAHHMAALPRQEGLSVTKEQLDAIKAGEHQHHLLQAICRANVRNSAYGMCGDCEVYVIGRMKPELLTETFPGAAIRDWQPIQRSLKGRAADVAEEIERRFSDPSIINVPKRELWSAVGFSSNKQLANSLKRPDLQRWMANQGLQNNTRHISRIAA
jgi:hypothetical protein